MLSCTEAICILNSNFKMAGITDIFFESLTFPLEMFHQPLEMFSDLYLRQQIEELEKQLSKNNNIF